MDIIAVHVGSIPSLMFQVCFLADFNMSETQKEHAAAIEKLVTDIATLRQNYCSHLSYGQFWMIYFVLLLPSLDDTSKELLSSTQVKSSCQK